MLLPTAPRLEGTARSALNQIVERPTSQRRHADRARWVLVLEAADGNVRAVADHCGISPTTVRAWARRVGEHDPEDLPDAARSSRPRLHDDTEAHPAVNASQIDGGPKPSWSNGRVS